MTVQRPDIAAAAGRIEGRVRRTPVLDVDIEGVAVTLKLELLQHTGSFKPRGAFSRILGSGGIPDSGVIAASGGNHGAAVAFAARELGIPAEIYVAEVTPQLKRDRIAGFGAKVVVGGHQYPDALETCRVRMSETGALEIHAYDHELTVAGQGTMGVELEEQVPDVATVLMSVGGGGFAAGSAAWFQGNARVVCVEPTGSPAFAAALSAGSPVDVSIDSVASDSLGARRVGEVPYACLIAAGAASVLVDDDAIRAAQRWLWDRLRLVVEPGGATATAAVLSGAYRPAAGERAVVVVCGANTEPQNVV